MNDPSAARSSASPLAELLLAHFSDPGSLDLHEDLRAVPRAVWEQSLAAPALEFLQRPGKGLRGRLMQLCYELCGGAGACPEPSGTVLEILHAGSLIVDDVEDESPMRRGGPALHVLYGNATSINVGSWMYFWALRLLERITVPESTKLKLYRRTHTALLRCHQGQALDLGARIVDLAQADVKDVVLAATALKTGGLLELASSYGAILAGAGNATVRDVARFGRRVGTALQMLDDLGGLLSESRCHKGHEDLVLGRPTWPWAWLSRDISPARYRALIEDERRVLKGELHPEGLARNLRASLQGAGRVHVRRYVESTFRLLGEEQDRPGALDELRSLVAAMEKSYG